MTFNHPYEGRPSWAFWSTAIAAATGEHFDIAVPTPFKIARIDRIATAGSCFAKELTRVLAADGFTIVSAEPPERDGAAYAARYGNIYTARQLRQLIERAYGLVSPRHVAWRRPDGRFVDPFRPREFAAGFATEAEVAAARAAHLRAVREAFETCSIFVFTLGLTEAWLCDADGMAVPLPPGVAASPEDASATVSPHNLGVGEVIDDLHASIDHLRRVNPGVKIILTVSPVQIAATYTADHVLVASTYSKAVLRVGAQAVAERHRDVVYFPGYEMIAANPLVRRYAENRRHVAPDGVALVMALFHRSFLEADSVSTPTLPDHTIPGPENGTPIESISNGLVQADLMIAEASEVMCDEDMLARSVAR